MESIEDSTIEGVRVGWVGGGGGGEKYNPLRGWRENQRIWGEENAKEEKRKGGIGGKG